ncbi:MAG TPA: hypothetical protein PLD54_03870 [Candidatus Levybacteria bacterium]|nr:hypothetical protein [Candidatus Levybacteria bacterium]
MSIKLQKLNPNYGALIGFISSIPFLVGNLIAVRNIEPFYSFLDSFATPLLPMSLLILFPIGALISALPMFKNKKIYLLNVIVSILLLLVFLILFLEFYKQTVKLNI